MKKEKKARMPFSNCSFSFWDLINLKKVFPLSRTILNSWQISSKSAWNKAVSWFRQDIFFLHINLAPRLPSFYIRTKFRLKNSVTTMRLAHFFIHIFKGEIYGKLKNIHLGKSRLILKKAFLICLHSSTLIYIRLHLSTFI